MAILTECPQCGRKFRAQDLARDKTLKCPRCGAAITVQGPRVPDHQVFISYSHKDKTFADAACAALESRQVFCWMAPRDISPGEDWGGAIIDAINDATIMLLIFSNHSNMSQQVVREVERAVAKGLTIVPFRIEDITLSKSLEYFLSACHWLDAFDSPNDESLERLSVKIRAMLAATAAPDPPPEPPLPPVAPHAAARPAADHAPRPSKKSPSLRRMGALSALALPALLLAAWLFHHYRSANSPTSSAPSATIVDAPNGRLNYGINGGTIVAYINGKPLPTYFADPGGQPARLLPGDHLVFRALSNSAQALKAVGFSFKSSFGPTPSFFSTAHSCTVRILPDPLSTPIPVTPPTDQHPRSVLRPPPIMARNFGEFTFDGRIEWLMVDGPGCYEFFFTVPSAPGAAAPKS